MNKQALLEIYREAFGNDGEFEDRLFSLCGEYLRTTEKDGNPVALLFALPCEIITKEQRFKAYYLFAAATKKIYRGKGYMTGLINNLIKEGKPIFLKPANEGLISFYERLGFRKFTAVTGEETKITAKPKDGFAELSVAEKECGTFSYTAMCENFPAPPDNLCFGYIME